MKHSSIKWIGNIPSDWEVTRIKYSVSLIGSGTTPASDNNEYYNGEYNWIQSGDLFNVNEINTTEKKISKLAIKTFQALNYYSSDFIVLAMYGASVGNVAISKIDAYSNQACCCIKPDKNTDLRYMYYFFVISKVDLIEKAVGGGQPNISQIVIKNEHFLKVSLSEQRAIAAFLDTQCSKIDSIIIELEQQIEILKQYKTSLITETVTKGLNKNIPMKNSGINWIGKIPAHWEVTKIKYLFMIVCGSTPESNNTEYWDGNIPWITPADMPDFGIISKGERAITKKGYNSCGTSIIPKGSIIISTRAPIGKVNINKAELCTNQGCKSLISFNTNLKYYFYLLYSNKEELERAGKGTTFIELGTFELGNHYILLPSLSEQHEIASFLDTKCKEITDIINEKQQSIDTMKAYKKSLIYEYVTGKKRVKVK